MTDNIATILMVDDSPASRDTLWAMLDNEPYRLVDAANGAEALRKAREIMPDLILLDVMMPEMDGYEVCRRIRADSLLAEVPIIMVTALDDRNSRLEGINAGADDFIAKPCDVMELRARVRAITKLNRYRLLHNQRVRSAQAEEKLRESEEKFRILFMDSPDPYLIFENGVCVECNRTAEAMFRCDRTRIIGQSPGELSPELQPDGRISTEVAGEKLDEAQRAGKITFEWVYRRLDGSEFYAEISLAPMLMNGVSVLFGTIRDISERKRVELELHQAHEAAEVAILAKSRFLANMNHELNTPMNGILGMIQITQFGHLDTQQRNNLDVALKSGFALVQVLNDIFDLTALEEQKTTLRHEPFSLRECIHDTVVMLTSEVVRKGLRLLTSVSDDVPQTVPGDQVRLRQVLTNLVGNAVKFTDKGTVSVQVAMNPRGISFIVTDTGIGIPRDKQSLLFSPFTQVDDSLTRPHGGTGLGLAICRELVELMGGTLNLESEEGRGSAFSFTLPMDKMEVSLTPMGPSR